MQSRTLTTLALVATVVCSTAPLLAGTAGAEEPPTTRPVQMLAVDRDGDGTHGIYRDGHTLLADSASSDVYALVGSQDGSRIAYGQDVYDANDELADQRIVVRDTTALGTPAFSRVVSDVTAAAGTVLEFAPALSPDGSQVVWTRLDVTGDTVTLSTQHAASASGGAATVAENLLGASFLDASTLIGTTETGIVTMPAAGGAQQPVPGLTSADGDFVVSPDGTHVAWLRDTSDPESDAVTAELHAAALALDAGVATLTDDHVLASGVDASGPSWTRDGTYVQVVAFDAVTGAGSVLSAVADGTGGTSGSTLTGDVGAVANVIGDAVAPAAATMLPIVLNGTSATVRWTLSDSDAYGVDVLRSGGDLPSKLVRVTGSSFTDTGLTLGKTYIYSVTSIDTSANLGPAISRQMTALQATATLPDPTSTRYYNNPAFRVYFPAGTYSVLYRTNGTGPLTPWVDHATAASQVFSTAKAGSSYGLLMTRYDTFGNSTAPTGIGTAVVPYDQTRATFSGSFAIQTLNERYLGNATILRSAGAAARLVVNGNRLQVIGEKCTSCGVMDVYVDGVRVAGVDTHDTQRRSRVVLYTRNLKAGVNHTVVIKARGTVGHPNVVLDGFGVRH